MMRGVLFIFLISIGFNVYPQAGSRSNPVVFKIKNFGVIVEGFFPSLTGVINFDALNPANSIFDVTINTKSVNTGIELRDNHLRKKEYFDVEAYPQIRFKSTSINRDGKSEKWIVSGRLTIKNVTKHISFPFVSKEEVLVGKFTINRRVFNVGGKSLSMGDEVIVELNVPNQKL
jgi:polyisoprenoid-binding protein YceI